MTICFAPRLAVAAAAFALALDVDISAAEAVAIDDLVPRDLPTTLAGSYLAGRSADTAHDLTAAIDYFGDVLAVDPKNPALLERVLVLQVADGKIAPAIEVAKELAEVDQSNPLARLVVAVEALKRGRFDKAEAELKLAAKAPLAVLTSGLLTAWAEQADGGIDDALKTIGALKGPSWYGIFKDYHQALIADLAGRKQDAVAAISRAYRTDPSALRVVEAYGRIVAYAGDKAEAIKALQGFVGQSPYNPVTRNLLDSLKAGKSPPPLATTAQAGAAEVLYGLGSAIGTEDGTELPAAYLQLANYLDPDAHLPLMALGDLLLGTDRWQDAIAVYDRIPQNSAVRRNADIQTGIALDMLDRVDEAAAKITRVVDANPADLDAVMALGNIYRAHSRFAEAAAAYTRGIETIPDPMHADWRIYYFRGIAYERSKEWSKAEADFKQALEIKPDQPQVLNYLGYSWVDMGMNLDEAMGMIRSAVELRPSDGYIIDSLGWAYFRLGEYEEAVEQLEKAVELRPEDSVINDHLGDALWKVGRKREATFQWKHARDLNPEPDARDKIVKKLESGMTADAGHDG